MAFITPLSTSLLSLLLLLSACTQPGDDYGFSIKTVVISPGYQKLSAQFRQQLSLSREAENALRNGVPLTLLLDMELRDSATLTLLAEDSRRYEIRFLPLNQHFQLSGPTDLDVTTYPRLRHVMNELARLRLNFNTGPLAPGKYEYRARTRLDNASLPAPMHLPALLSADWKHDSEWSSWPFEINA